MKMKLSELRGIVADVVSEARRKKPKKPKKTDDAPDTQPHGYMSDPKLDFSRPLDDENLYRRQGASNLGPYTSEGAIRLVIRQMISEAIAAGRLDEKYVGFKALKKKLSRDDGVDDPAALAASIGRKKYGAKGMARKAAAGRKK